MKKNLFLAVIICISLSAATAYSQKGNSSVNQITAADLESYVTFLASPLLKGRMNGEEELDIAAQFIASQAKLIGLKPGNGTSFLQPYSIHKTTMDPEKTSMKIVSNAKDTIAINKPFYQLVPTGPTDLDIQGEVVFAGYGIRSQKYKYNDFENLNAEGKIILIMERAPMSEDGKKSLFEEPEWSSRMSFNNKLMALPNLKPKAILIVPDPKSGIRSISDSGQGLAEYISSKTSLAGEPEEKPNPIMAMLPKIIFIDRALADELLKGSGHTLEELQKNIDASFKPNSFLIPNKQLIIKEVTRKEVKIMNNVAGYIEGSDPVLKNEVIIFSGHYDHIGVTGSGINTGADDNASGCAALLSMAEAFQSLNKKPLRSILFLWVSGEEIGLYGSKSYVNMPLFPLDKTVADLNMDMIGRVKEEADSTKDTPMTGANSVFVITDNQSKDLIAIADAVDKKSILDFDYSLSGRDNPLQLFSRSDHYNFVEKDIPVLFFSSGIHADYHTPGDVIEKIDFKKMELVTRTMYEIGLTVANRKNRIVVDNPFSTWGKSK
ncbi:MAG: M28 family peptidase [Bacteroidales bacterium]|nr:M28 family peptidase [Bacteroidales bacterium]